MASVTEYIGFESRLIHAVNNELKRILKDLCLIENTRQD
jgi:hypothetical protein